MAKKTSSNRKYTPEFKADVLRLVANGESILGVARKMGISDSIIHSWRAAEKKTKTRSDGGGGKSTTVLEDEVETLRRQHCQTEMKRDILKKALAIFSRMS
ncbi:transposase [Persicitalea jodogahamensis]|uniref:Transposase n=1 Tax=Persicitalea jodogahamensis TaxID=402147 RepID=A0A8J3D504_9BACT|nr:transposase [Persicitalea jodogahamensis]GHB74855.1 transposase [Persicitalea jodogahamensis]